MSVFLLFTRSEIPYRLLRSTSAFLQTRLEYLRPTPLIFVNANIVFSFPSTLVFNSRKMCYSSQIGKIRDLEQIFTWNELFSPLTSDCNILACCFTVSSAWRHVHRGILEVVRYGGILKLFLRRLVKREVILQELPRSCQYIVGMALWNAYLVTNHDCGIVRSICSVVAGFVLDWEG